MSKKFALIASTGGSVVKTIKRLRPDFHLDLVIVDRDCGAANLAVEHGIPLERVGTAGIRRISDEILSHLENHKIEYAYVFYTRLLHGDLLKKYEKKLINFHPSILPACPGMHGFEDTLKSGAMLAGATVHFINDGMDTGEIMLQSFTEIGDKKPHELRHEIFAQQCASLYFVHNRLKNGDWDQDKKKYPMKIDQGFLPNINPASLDIFHEIINNNTV